MSDSRPAGDVQLLRAARTDPDAFGEFYRRHVVMLSRRRAFRLAAAGTVSLAASATAIVLTLSATAGTPPAYALTTNGDGSVTVTINDLATTASETLTFTLGRKYLAPGYTGLVAAEQLPNGEVGMAVEAVKPPVPSCVSSVAYTVHTTGATDGVPTITQTPVNPPTTTNPAG